MSDPIIIIAKKIKPIDIELFEKVLANWSKYQSV